MADEQERAEIIMRGHKAKDVLQNDAFVEAYESILNQLFMSFCSTHSEDIGEREKNWAIAQALKSVKDRLEAFHQTALVEEANKKADSL